MSNTNAMVAHLWAQQEKSRAHSSNGNFSFEGKVLYSYSTPIAAFVETKRGKAVLVTSRRYSRTTSSKHMPALWRALWSEQRGNAFTVPNVRPVGKIGHLENLAHLGREYYDIAKRVERMRDYHGDVAYLTGQLAAIVAEVDNYARLFSLGRHKPRLDSVAEAKRVMDARAKREAKRNTPAEIAKREKARAAREALQRRRDELARADSAERIEAWKRGEPVTLRHYEIAEFGTAMLRVKGDKLETSLGATVPLDHAIRVFRFVKLCRERGEEWQCNGRSLRVGHFQVHTVRANGDFHAGCHFIAWAETEAAAKAAGVADLAAEDTRTGDA